MTTLLCDGCKRPKKDVENVASPLSPINVYLCPACREMKS